MTQCDRVLDHLKTKGSITSNEAEDLYGIRRLASRIADLKEAGYSISSTREDGKNRFGEPTHYARYTLNGGN